MKEKERQEKREWKTRALHAERDQEDLQQLVKETKKQNKLLKLAIGKLQNELEMKSQADNTFLTEANADDKTGEMKVEKILEILKSDHIDKEQLSILENSQLLDTTANTSLFDMSKRSPRLDKSMMTTDRKLQRSKSKPKSPNSHYRFLPTQNIKFEKFLEVLFSSKMDND